MKPDETQMLDAFASGLVNLTRAVLHGRLPANADDAFAVTKRVFEEAAETCGIDSCERFALATIATMRECKLVRALSRLNAYAATPDKNDKGELSYGAVHLAAVKHILAGTPIADAVKAAACDVAALNGNPNAASQMAVAYMVTAMAVGDIAFIKLLAQAVAHVRSLTSVKNPRIQLDCKFVTWSVPPEAVRVREKTSCVLKRREEASLTTVPAADGQPNRPALPSAPNVKRAGANGTKHRKGRQHASNQRLGKQTGRDGGNVGTRV